MTDSMVSRTRASSPWPRRLGLLFAAAVVLILLGSLAFHLQGRARFRDASARFVSELGTEIPSLSREALFEQTASFAPQALPETENAAHWLMAGGKAMVWDKEEIELSKVLSGIPTSQWTADQLKSARDMVERNSGGLETMHRAVSLTGSNYGVDYADLLNSEIPNLIELMNAGHLLGLEARLAFLDDNTAVGFEALETLARLTDSLRHETVLIFALIAHVIEKIQLQGIAEVLTHPASWAANLETLERLEGLMPGQDLQTFNRKVLALDAAITAISAIDGKTDPWAVERPSRLRTYYLGYREAAGYLDLGRQAVSLVSEPYGLNQERFTTLAGKHPRGLGRGYRNGVSKGQAMMSQRRLVAAALELRRIGLSQGAYPADCSALDLVSSPDPLVGKPLVCQPGDDGSLRLEVPGAAEMAPEISPKARLWIHKLNLPAWPT